MVQHSDDSVIHKNYNAEHKRTVEARRVHLERLNSMPNMKVDTQLLRLANKDTCSVKHTLLPLEEIDDDKSSHCHSFQFAKHPFGNVNLKLESNFKDTILELQELGPMLRISGDISSTRSLKGSIL